MKKRILRTLISVACTAALCVSLAAPAFAAQKTPMEIASDRAVEAAIKAGTVPAGTTIYDCMYGSENGVTVVIQYKDKDGNWIDVKTGKKVVTQEPEQKKTESQPGISTEKLSEETLAEYTAEVFRLVNEEREKAGLEPVVRDSLLDEAAMLRAAEVKIVDDADGKPHTRPDGTSWRTLLDDMGIDRDRCAENLNRAKATPQAVMESWMNSDGHRDIILRERYGSIGIGVYQRPDGKLDWIQIFERK